MEKPHNPHGLPVELDFELAYDTKLGVVTQTVNKKTSELLKNAYEFGNELGNPLSENELGKPYADDFLGVILNHFPVISSEMRALEIGAGTGYLLNRIAELGFNAMGIEPGKGYSNHWDGLKTKIVNDFFPSSQVNDEFDLICAYMVLEHIENPLGFLTNIVTFLKPNGIAIIAVPDCTEELQVGDGSILIHEHISYFDFKSLRALCAKLGLNVEVVRSGYGRCLYATINNSSQGISITVDTEKTYLSRFASRVEMNVRQIKIELSKLASQGSLGIYCPARALHLITTGMELRFFDDDVNQTGKYIPPFNHQIENRASLIKSPVDNLVILSRTFGTKISENLRREGYLGRIHLITDFYTE
jgi:hypothetical protein